MTDTLILDRIRHLRSLQERLWSVPFDVLPHQVPPDFDWWFWLLEAGRGAGKTAAAAHYVKDHFNGPPCISGSLPHRGLLIAPTIGDGIESASLNDQALTRIDRNASLTSSGGGTRVEWANGSMMRVVGTSTKDDIERLRAAGNNCIVWGEELAAWRRLQEAIDIMLPGLRVGPDPRFLATTTPKARPEYVKVRGMADHISHATTADNPHLNERQRQRLYDLYEGTSIGKQELLGQLIEEADGALWTYELIERARLSTLLTDWLDDNQASLDEGDGALAPPYGRVVVAIDPPGGATEAGIVTAAIVPDCQCGTDGPLPHFVVLADDSGKLSPNGWGSRGVEAYHLWEGDRVIGESNYGGDMVKATVANVDSGVPFDMVHASRGKRIRAEPIKGLYEQSRVHHVGDFPELEAEQVQWIPDESTWSPNRLDALVWAITYLSTTGGADWWSA